MLHCFIRFSLSSWSSSCNTARPAWAMNCSKTLRCTTMVDAAPVRPANGSPSCAADVLMCNVPTCLSAALQHGNHLKQKRSSKGIKALLWRNQRLRNKSAPRIQCCRQKLTLRIRCPSAHCTLLHTAEPNPQYPLGPRAKVPVHNSALAYLVAELYIRRSMAATTFSKLGLNGGVMVLGWSYCNNCNANGSTGRLRVMRAHRMSYTGAGLGAGEPAAGHVQKSFS